MRVLRSSRWRTRFPGLCAATLAASLAAGCHNPYPPELVPVVKSEDTAPELYQPVLEGDYVIGPGDTLLVQSYYDADLKQPVLVRPDGHLSLLLIGEVMAAGKTPVELSKELTRLYGRVLDRPDITVSVTASAGMTVYVAGEVKSPSQLPLKSDLTLLQSITEAGGFLSTANKEQVLVIRRTPDGHFRTYQQNVEAVLKNEAGQLYLRRHDIVYVPKTQIARADEYVEQHINSILPHALTGIFGYQYLHTSSPSPVITP